MIILDKPFASQELKEYLQTSATPVLENDFAREIKKDYDLNLKNEKEFRKLLIKNKNLLTISENSLKWIYENLEDEAKISGIETMKNKAVVRKLLAGMYPDFFFAEVSAENLKNISFGSLKTPFVLKPSIGFFSVGVYAVSDEKSWNKAVEDINADIKKWKKEYCDEVIGKSSFIMEEYIEGEEYALDAYYDENGEAVILNIFKHDFSSDADVSDRLYYSSKQIIESNIKDFTAFLNCVNRFFKVKNFPLHTEIRVKDGKIIPIEFNPMRFAGWCTTDLSYFAYGFHTCDYFFRKAKPDWETLLKEKNNKIYAFILLNKTPSCTRNKKFDYEAAAAKFKKVLCMRKIKDPNSPVFGFIFTETEEKDRNELDYIMRSDLSEFLKDG